MKKIESFIREIPDFPKSGVNFKDITPLLQDPQAMRETLDLLVEMVGDEKIDKVVGIESRGFLFGTLLAARLGAGFVPVRKPGKLPYKTHTEVYDLEYGKDTLEIHQDGIKKGENVLLHDDVLATGGTARAACNLIERMGGNIIQCNFLSELSYLDGRRKLRDYEVESLLIY